MKKYSLNLTISSVDEWGNPEENLTLKVNNFTEFAGEIKSFVDSLQKGEDKKYPGAGPQYPNYPGNPIQAPMDTPVNPPAPDFFPEKTE